MAVGTSSSSLREAVVAAGVRWSSGQHELVRLVAALDESGEWAADGAATCAHWVADALDVEVCTAREWVRIGRALADLPLVDEAFAARRLSYSKVRTITRVATPDTEAELCRLAERIPASRLACSLATWQARRETPEATERRHQAGRRLGWRVDIDGMVVGSYRLPPAEAAVLHSAVDAMVRNSSPDASADAWPSFAQQRADALVALVRGGGGTVTTEVVVHVRGDGCTFDDGTPVTHSVVERLAPAGFLRALIHDAAGRPINASWRRRHPSARQRHVVRERDRACVDCGSTEFLECDHDPPFEQSRRTVVDELSLRCPSCHHRRHRGTSGRPYD
jgi:hypothetical protein